MSEAACRAYLLGKLAETEAEQVETRLLQDPDLFSQMETAEDDLFDAFARGALDQEDRVLFLKRFGGEVSRRRFAAAFVTRTASGNIVPFVHRTWVPLAIAASLVLVVGTVVVRQPEVPVRLEPAASTAPTAPATSTPEVTMRVPLALGRSRSTGAPVQVSIQRDATRIDFAIRLNPADRYAVYAIEIRSAADNVVWGERMTTPVIENGELTLHAMVPSDRVPPGSYEVSIRGGANGASLDDLGFLSIEVSRAQ